MTDNPAGEEIWKQIPGHPNYAASSLGRIKRIKTDMVLKLDNSRPGKQKISIQVNGKAKNFSVHRLIMLAFHGPSDLVVDHLNGNPHDNRLENLEYVTYRTNASRAARCSVGTPLYRPKRDRWYFGMKINGKHTYHSFKTKEEAEAAYWKLLQEVDPISYEQIKRRSKNG